MFVCICKQVTDTEIFEELESGAASTFDDIQQRLGVATQCGKCTNCAKREIRKHKASQIFHIPLQPVPAPAG